MPVSISGPLPGNFYRSYPKFVKLLFLPPAMNVTPRSSSIIWTPKDSSLAIACSVSSAGKLNRACTSKICGCWRIDPWRTSSWSTMLHTPTSSNSKTECLSSHTTMTSKIRSCQCCWLTLRKQYQMHRNPNIVWRNSMTNILSWWSTVSSKTSARWWRNCTVPIAHLIKLDTKVIFNDILTTFA